jgi:hypothetical protein
MTKNLNIAVGVVIWISMPFMAFAFPAIGSDFALITGFFYGIIGSTFALPAIMFKMTSSGNLTHVCLFNKEL